jgi:hypothetical protein
MVLHPFPVELSGPIVRFSLRRHRCRRSELHAAPVDRWSDARTAFQPNRAALVHWYRPDQGILMRWYKPRQEVT